ncbi:hypothetical protein F4777DRAFT_239052 [Nemania sp. FL0916]|nr:hypothetical protein F4777DRAFT_239052 [Nemania sp. FL0916]
MYSLVYQNWLQVRSKVELTILRTLRISPCTETKAPFPDTSRRVTPVQSDPCRPSQRGMEALPLRTDPGPLRFSPDAVVNVSALVIDGVNRDIGYHAKNNIFLTMAFLNWVKSNWPPVVVPLLGQWLRISNDGRDFETKISEFRWLLICSINGTAYCSLQEIS